MIRFNCSKCGMKLQVRDEFAGRPCKCPTCSHPLAVPQAALAATVPSGPIAGTTSSLGQAGISGGVSLDSASNEARRSLGTSVGGRDTEGRYVIEAEIARGGMGAVLRAVDRDIRREVALKYMLDGRDSRRQARFVEEAQITGQLEHPNIVPVHELGIDAQRRLFFTMKMVRGRSLAQVIETLRTDPKTAEKDWPLTRLLTIFVNICHALAYAHARNVVHRDLKPANIMVGDFGEVYVMDWGLAKVLTGDDDPEAEQNPPLALRAPGSATGSDSGSGSGRVVTDRETDGELTQDGAVVGTPVYMPPEQARGQVNAIDQRSDIYSLGAILYELLTLETPVDKEGGSLAILMRVGHGEILPPEKRVPVRARHGQIPRELAAIAMKALALEPRKRFQTVTAMRRDLELFQAGRSVSAKVDSRLEAVTKFVKRNKAVSAATAAALVVLTAVLGVAFHINYEARLQAEEEQQKAQKAFSDFEHEQRERETAIKRSVPAFVRAARQLANEGDLVQARNQAAFALTYDPDNIEARILKAQILMSQKNWREAHVEMETCLKQRPDDRELIRLDEAGKRAQKGDAPALYALAEMLQRQKAYGLARTLLQEADRSLKGRRQQIPLYQKQIEEHWPGLGPRFTLDPLGRFQLNFTSLPQVVDLDPLRRMPINILLLQASTNFPDLEPLRGMPLMTLNLSGCTQISDLEPLRGMPLTTVYLSGLNKVRDLRPLAGMKLTTLWLTGCSLIEDLEPLRGMPLTSLALNNCPRLHNVDALRGLQLTTLDLASAVELNNIEGLHGMPLTSLNLGWCYQLRNIEPLKGMPLTSLTMPASRLITSLEPLKDMPLTRLDLRQSALISDLSPLKDLPLEILNVVGSPLIRNLEPLKDTKLRVIAFNPKIIQKGIEVLRDMPSLQTIEVDGTRSLTAPEFWRRYDAGEFKK